MKYRLECVTCRREFEADPRASTCPECGPMKGTLDVIYPFAELRSHFPKNLNLLQGRSIFEAFSDILPFDKLESLPPLRVGDTPLIRSPLLSQVTGIANLWIKDDSRNPSASLKDRASAIAVAIAGEVGANTIAVASTGNAASSLATMAASVSMKAVLFVPGNAPRPKLAQILIHGGRVLRLDCDYDTAFDLCQVVCEKFGWYNRNTAVNPFTGEGKKTVALEIARDMGRAPDAVICPVGDGCIIGGVHKGFRDLLGLGLIDHIPRLYGVQAEGACPVVKAYQSGSDIRVMSTVTTIADSIAVGHPRDGVKALRAVRETSGAMIAVSDREILEAQKVLAAKAGVFAEPAASASLAGLLKLVAGRMIGKRENVVILITGHGLKDIDTAIGNVAFDSEVIKPHIDSVERKIARFL